MKGRHQNLIGRKSAKAFGMVTFNLDPEPENEPNVNQVATKTELSKDELASMFPELFSGKLGRIKDTEVKLEVDENIKPIKQPLRPIAFHYRNAVEKELEKQVAEGILEKVDAKTSPITWISNLVIVPKDRKPVQASNGKMSKPKQGNPEPQSSSQAHLRLETDE